MSLLVNLYLRRTFPKPCYWQIYQNSFFSQKSTLFPNGPTYWAYLLKYTIHFKFNRRENACSKIESSPKSCYLLFNIIIKMAYYFLQTFFWACQNLHCTCKVWEIYYLIFNVSISLSPFPISLIISPSTHLLVVFIK